MKSIDITYENFHHVEKIDVNIVMNLQKNEFFHSKWWNDGENNI